MRACGGWMCMWWLREWSRLSRQSRLRLHWVGRDGWMDGRTGQAKVPGQGKTGQGPSPSGPFLHWPQVESALHCTALWVMTDGVESSQPWNNPAQLRLLFGDRVPPFACPPLACCSTTKLLGALRE